MTEQFTTWKVKFDIDFDIKPVMAEEEKIAEHQLLGSLMTSERKILFQVNFYNIYILLFF